MLTAERVRELLDYNSETGEFVWRVTKSNRAMAGTVAGGMMTNGYRTIGIDRKAYLAHRIAWLWTFGRWPDGNLDHKNGDRTDNRIANLRECDQSQNTANARRWSHNTSGFKGVTYDKSRQRWAAQIHKGGRHYYLGRFDTPEAAAAAYIIKARELFGPYAKRAKRGYGH